MQLPVKLNLDFFSVADRNIAWPGLSSGRMQLDYKRWSSHSLSRQRKDSSYLAVFFHKFIEWAKIQGPHRTGANAGRLFTLINQVHTQVALGHAAGSHIILRRSIGAAPLAIAAAQALFPVNKDYSIRPFAYSSGGTTFEANRLLTMIAAQGKIIGNQIRHPVISNPQPPAAAQLIDSPPSDAGRPVVFITTGQDTAFAGRAGTGVKEKGVLNLARLALFLVLGFSRFLLISLHIFQPEP